MAEIILPPGSNSAHLQAAIDSAAAGDRILLSSDMLFTDTVILGTGQEITIGSIGDNAWVLSQPQPGIRHFNVAGTLVLQNIVLNGHHSSGTQGGGGIQANSGLLSLGPGLIIENCYAASHGGAIFLINSILIINDALIQHNGAGSHGGAIYVSNSDITMLKGQLSHNTASNNGGAIHLAAFSSCLVLEGIFSGNQATSSGGGIYASNSEPIIIYQGIFEDNRASYGGGIYVSQTILDVDEGIFIANQANYGGAIYGRNSDFINVHTGPNTIFSCNRGYTAHQPPADAAILYPQLQFASTTITNHPINNYDVNNMNEPIIDATFHINYAANGGNGSYAGPSLEPCGIDTVLPLSATGICRFGYIFTIWNTRPNGQGIPYAPGEELSLSRDIILYAQWQAKLYTIAYEPNGGKGSYSQQAPYDSLYRVASVQEAGISRMMCAFRGWNTSPDGKGLAYDPGSFFIINGATTLYAQWQPITRHDTINMILAARALQELGMAQLLNAEGEKLQYALGTLAGTTSPGIRLRDILALNNSVQKTLRELVRGEMLPDGDYKR